MMTIFEICLSVFLLFSIFVCAWCAIDDFKDKHWCKAIIKIVFGLIAIVDIVMLFIM